MKEVCEICEEQLSMIVKHHIHSQSKGGTNKKSNIANICSNCHADVHHGLIVIEGRWNSTHGNILVFRKWNEPYVITEDVPDVWLYPNAKVNRKRYIDNTPIMF